MKKEIKNKSVIYPIIIMLFFCAIVLLQAEFILESDDGRYCTALQNKDWALLSINNRVLVNIIVVLVEACGVYFWKICNLIICAFLFTYMIKIALVITGKCSDMYLNIIFTGITFLIPITVLSSGLFWATGSFSYAWGVVGCFMYIYPFLCKLFEKKCSTGEYALAILGGIYAGNLEQSSAVQFCFSSIIMAYLFYKKCKIEKKYYLLYAIAAVSLIVLLILPFNQNRTLSAIVFYYPDFNMLTVVDKLYQGIIWLYSHLVIKNTVIMLIFTGVIFFRLLNTKESAAVKIMALFPFLYFLGYVFIKSGIFLGHNIEQMYSFNTFKFNASMGLLDLMPVMIVTGILLVELYLLFVTFDRNEQSICAVLLYLAGLASALVLAFSPTIFASANRTFFLLDIFLVLIIGMVMYTGKEEKDHYKYIAFGMCMVNLVVSIVYNIMCRGIIIY